MIDCLDNYIGLRQACGGTTPDSGKYVDDLPGIDRSVFELLTKSQEGDYVTAWDRVYGLAVDNMIADVAAYLPTKKMRANQIVSSVRAGRLSDEASTLSSSADYRGWYIHVHGSEHLQIMLDKCQLYAASGGTVTVKVFDAHTGLELYTSNKTVVEGWNEFRVNQLISMTGTTREVFICYDASTIDTIQTDSVVRGNSKHLCVAGSVDKTTAVLEDNIDTSGEGNGFMIFYQVLCGIDSFICKNRHRLSNAIRYRAAVELLMRAYMNTASFSHVNAQDSERIKQRIQMYEDQYNLEMSQVLKNLEPSFDQMCFECDSPVRIQSQIPG